MTNGQLLVDLFYRLPNPSDAMVLHVLLLQHADIHELRTSASRIARDALQTKVSPSQVRNTLKKLEELGLIAVRIHPNYRTLVSVNRAAVARLLQEPVSHSLPGLGERSFPFLDYLNGRHSTSVRDEAETSTLNYRETRSPVVVKESQFESLQEE